MTVVRLPHRTRVHPTPTAPQAESFGSPRAGERLARRRVYLIAASSENSARAEFEAGKLVRVLSDWDFGSMEVNALFVNGKTIKPAARAFADFLLTELRAREREALKPTDAFRTLTELLEQSASGGRGSGAEGGRPS